jgi:cupin 2 domain-containing protein
MDRKSENCTLGSRMNLLAPIAAALPAERLDILALGHGPFRLERIVSRQHASPPGFWYDQPGPEWVLLLSGSAVLLFEEPSGQILRHQLSPGDFLEIPAHRRHRVEQTDPTQDTIWLALHAADGTTPHAAPPASPDSP